MPFLPTTTIIIDDDASVRRALGRVMTSAGIRWLSFASVEEFLAQASPADASCIVADITMLGMSGLELKQLLNSGHHSDIPVIFLTAHDTEEMRVAASEAAAVGFFRKPVDTQALLDAIQWASRRPGRETPRLSADPA